MIDLEVKMGWERNGWEDRGGGVVRGGGFSVSFKEGEEVKGLKFVKMKYYYG